MTLQLRPGASTAKSVMVVGVPVTPRWSARTSTSVELFATTRGAYDGVEGATAAWAGETGTESEAVNAKATIVTNAGGVVLGTP